MLARGRCQALYDFAIDDDLGSVDRLVAQYFTGDFDRVEFPGLQTDSGACRPAVRFSENDRAGGDSAEEQAAFKAWCERNGANGPRVRYQKGGRKQTFRGGGFMAGGDFERAVGEGNKLELYAVGDRSVHVVNGKVALVLSGLRQTIDGKEVPLTKGRIELQTESAEVFFRNLRVRPMTQIPPGFLE